MNAVCDKPNRWDFVYGTKGGHSQHTVLPFCGIPSVFFSASFHDIGLLAKIDLVQLLYTLFANTENPSDSCPQTQPIHLR